MALAARGIFIALDIFVIWVLYGFLAAMLRGLALVLSFLPALDRRWLLRQRLRTEIPEQFDFWLHGASLGEVQVCLKMAELLKSEGDIKVLLTCQTRAALDMLRGLNLSGVQYCIMPLDGSRAIHQILRRAAPRAVIIYESELWPCFLKSCKSEDVPVYWLGVRVGPGLRRLFRLFPKSMNQILSCYKGIGLLDPLHGECFEKRQILSGVWDLKMLRDPRFEKKGGAAKALLSWHVEELEVARRILGRGLNETWYIQLRKIEQKNEFAVFWRDHGFEVKDWPAIPRVGGICLVAEYGTTPEVMERCSEVWIGGGYAKTSHSPREAMLAGAKVWVGPSLPLGDPQLERWIQMGLVGLCDSTGLELRTPSHSLDIEYQFQNVSAFFDEFNVKHPRKKNECI